VFIVPASSLTRSPGDSIELGKKQDKCSLAPRETLHLVDPKWCGTNNFPIIPSLSSSSSSLRVNRQIMTFLPEV